MSDLAPPYRRGPTAAEVAVRLALDACFAGLYANDPPLCPCAREAHGFVHWDDDCRRCFYGRLRG